MTPVTSDSIYKTSYTANDTLDPEHCVVVDEAVGEEEQVAQDVDDAREPRLHVALRHGADDREEEGARYYPGTEVRRLDDDGLPVYSGRDRPR